METKINSELEKVFKSFDDKYYVDGTLNKGKVIEDLTSYNESLLKKLLDNDYIKSNYTVEVDNNIILKVNDLRLLLEMNNYWESSYTKYLNKIGLTNNGKYLNEVSDVVIDFPYKDTILKASMSKEDNDKNDMRPDEPFLNEIIAKEEIDVLLDKKIFKNIKKYSKHGEHYVKSFNDKDNLIIKGNNLLALHSLKDRYATRIKLIYIDPPYNTGNDSFRYNDKFNRSTWLVFMKNRLEVAWSLLKNDGVLAIQCDNNELHYLKVLCDEILGHDKFVTQLNIEMSLTQGMKVSSAQSGNIVKNGEYILLFSKNGNKNIAENILYEHVKGYDNHYSHYLVYNQKKDNYKRVNLIEYIENNEEVRNYFDEFNLKVSYKNFDILMEISKDFQKWLSKNSGYIFQETMASISIPDEVKERLINGEIVKHKDYILTMIKSSGNIRQFIPLKRALGWSHDYVSVYGRRRIRGDYWKGYYSDMMNVQKEGRVHFKNGKKPERLIKDLIYSLTNEDDIVMDFFLGSGTTCVVAHKMNRQYVGIEQLEYHENSALNRLSRTIKGDQSGISKEVAWQDGGSFIYAELMEKNIGFIKSIYNTEKPGDLRNILNHLIENAEIDFKVDLLELNKTFNELSFDDQKKALIKVIEKNQLYYNYSEINDDNVRDLVSDSDYEFNKSFYEEDNNE